MPSGSQAWQRLEPMPVLTSNMSASGACILSIAASAHVSNWRELAVLTGSSHGLKKSMSSISTATDCRDARLKRQALQLGYARHINAKRGHRPG